jgi:DNA-binding response OmpR family regulator
MERSDSVGLMRVLLLEDEPDLGNAIKWALQQDKYVVDWAQDGEEGWLYLAEQSAHYTAAIVDWMLPGLFGIEVCRRLRDRHNSLPVLMLTAKDTLADKITGLDAGADDYLVKPFEMEELLARLRALHRRSPQIQIRQLQLGGIELDYTNRAVYHQAADGTHRPLTLTNKEFQLLEYFMEHPLQIVSGDQLLDRLWEVGSDVTTNAVAAQIRLLRRKLKDTTCPDLIETIPSMGYRVNPKYAK